MEKAQEEVEGRSLASIRERDADRVGESWVRSHKEVDTRRHLNPPCPPSRRSLPPRLSHRFVPPSIRAPSHRLSHREPPTDLPHPSSAVASFCFALVSLRSPYARYILFLFLPFARPPSLFSFSRSLARAFSLHEALSSRSHREGTHPRSTKREAKATRGTSRVVGGFFCYYRQMLCLVKRGEEGRGGEIERGRRTKAKGREEERQRERGGRG